MPLSIGGLRFADEDEPRQRTLEDWGAARAVANAIHEWALEKARAHGLDRVPELPE